jgi:hypothetical protein
MAAETILVIVAGIAAPSHVDAQNDDASIEVVFANAVSAIVGYAPACSALGDR